MGGPSSLALQSGGRGRAWELLLGIGFEEREDLILREGGRTCDWPFLRVSGTSKAKVTRPSLSLPTSGLGSHSVFSAGLPRCGETRGAQGKRLGFRVIEGLWVGAVYVCVCIMAWTRTWRGGCWGQRLGLGVGGCGGGDGGTQLTHWELAFGVEGPGHGSEKRKESGEGMGLK